MSETSQCRRCHCFFRAWTKEELNPSVDSPENKLLAAMFIEPKRRYPNLCGQCQWVEPESDERAG